MGEDPSNGGNDFEIVGLGQLHGLCARWSIVWRSNETFCYWQN